MLYLDSSALVKLVLAEPETPRLKEYLEQNRSARYFSSMLAHAEVLRAVRPAGPLAMGVARRVLAACYLVDVTRSILERAGVLDAGINLRTLDAIHVVTASVAEERLRAVVTYDLRMAKAVEAMGFVVQAP